MKKKKKNKNKKKQKNKTKQNNNNNNNNNNNKQTNKQTNKSKNKQKKKNPVLRADGPSKQRSLFQVMSVGSPGRSGLFSKIFCFPSGGKNDSPKKHK